MPISTCKLQTKIDQKCVNVTILKYLRERERERERERVLRIHVYICLSYFKSRTC